MKRIDLNADLGESFGAYTIGMDEEILRSVTSANVACGFHAGDPTVMARTVHLAKEAGVAVGAHPGFPDLQGFGRRNLAMSPGEAASCVIYQVGALRAFLSAEGMRLQHVKLHGALYNMAAADYELSRAICDSIRKIAPDAVFLGLSGSRMLEAARDAGLQTAGEVFADRAYNDDGSLVSRRLPGAVLHDPEEAIARTVRMVTEGKVRSINGRDLPIRADSVCVHGDNESALVFVRRIREALEQAGVSVCPITARG